MTETDTYLFKKNAEYRVLSSEYSAFFRKNAEYRKLSSEYSAFADDNVHFCIFNLRVAK